uniref:Low molecular weight phosphotyrosine protein phosphatase n=1 Tax=Plectus sambesii TaxID=2011161 RepID=A0A914UP46_9BILA
MTEKKSVLFICLGNICRSPIAEAVFIELLKERGLTDQWVVDSAAVINYHEGKGPEKRAVATLNSHGITDYHHRVRQVTKDDFSKFDYIFGMDDANISDLTELAQKAKGAKKAHVSLLGLHDPEGERIIPDPYYESGSAMFEQVYQQCVRSCAGFLDSLEKMILAIH